ncbi:TonB-dependent receptor [Swaminathania salitolerans]|uniref:TonB-dependent receptor n=2 Tax=Swaminathania salitolerans TaxID=182838 RepID=A0A511BU90_9PROT|nr:TonB-dependent receptor [Swaminathania salitolerans]
MTLLNARTLSEAIRYTAGVSDYGSKDDPRGYFGTIRGFSPDIYLDGTRAPDASSAQSFSIEPWGLEEMDVLRGASSALYGSGQLGGIVNAVSKRPRPDQTDELSFQTGAYGRVQGAADLGGAFDGDKAWLWRLNGLIRKSGSYARNIRNNEIYVAPALSWRPDRETVFTLLSSFEQLDAGSTAQFLPASGTVFPSRWGRIARNILTSDADYDVYSKRQAAVGYHFAHEILPHWSIVQNMRYAHLDVLYRFVTTTGLSASQREIARRALNQQGNYNTVTLDTRSVATFATGLLHHTVLTGIDFRSDFLANRRGQRAAPSLDLYAPRYRRIVWPAYASTISTNQTGTDTGLYVQDQSRFGRWFLTLSGRGDFTQGLTVDNRSGGRTPQENDAFTGRVGLVYRSGAGLNPYISYATSFQPVTGTDVSGKAFVPMTGRQIEAGVKYRPAPLRGLDDLMLTADVFSLTENNVLTPDPVNTSFSVQTGQQRTRGVECEGSGRLPGGIDFIASFTWQDPRVTRSNVVARIGQRPVTVPSHMASFFLSRDVALEGPWHAGIGSGMRYTGNTAGALPATFLVPSQLVWDLEAHLDRGRTRLKLNGTNIADRRYVAICTRDTACAWAPGRAFFLTLSQRW